MQISVTRLAPDMVRIQARPAWRKKNSALTDYGFLFDAAVAAAPEAACDTLEIREENGRCEAFGGNGRKLFTLLECAPGDTAAETVFEAFDPDEDWMGFGDQTRDRLFHRGFRIECEVDDVVSYLPVPWFMSTRGYGILVNTTHHVTFDMASAEPGRFGWLDRSGVVDFYVIAAPDFKSLLRRYLALTGNPELPPLWSFGLWYICRTQADADEVMRNAVDFRREQLPCDVIGLEPGWMQKDYDLSCDKNWNKARFDLDEWQKTGKHHFIRALKRMGFHLELWLCCDYDLGFEEERRRGRNAVAAPLTEAEILARRKDIDIDGHLGEPILFDKITRPGEAWFEHLKQFVDWGADFFKQDGAFQVCFHPDRFWRGSRMTDEEMHNLYPLLYSRQMKEGLEEYTGKRGVVFTVAGWVGFQHYCGTWTGDTGGRIETLGAMLNTAIVGHSWCTNDLEATEAEGIHFGYLLPWSQINSWTYFRMPWVQGDALLAMHRFYAQFRAQLVPYLYSYARCAAQGGAPLLLPLALEFPGDRECRKILHEYLLGRDLLVGIYRKEMYFPAGEWRDFWTGEIIVSQGEFRIVDWPADRGGALYLRRGALVPLGPVMAYRGERELDAMTLWCFPGAADHAECELYEDDGVSFAYRDGGYALTRIAMHREADRLRLSILPPEGEAKFVPAARNWQLVICLPRAPRAVRVDGIPAAASEDCFDAARGELRLTLNRMAGVVELDLA